MTSFAPAASSLKAVRLQLVGFPDRVGLVNAPPVMTLGSPPQEPMMANASLLPPGCCSSIVNAFIPTSKPGPLTRISHLNAAWDSARIANQWRSYTKTLCTGSQAGRAEPVCPPTSRKPQRMPLAIEQLHLCSIEDGHTRTSNFIRRTRNKSPRAVATCVTMARTHRPTGRIAVSGNKFRTGSRHGRRRHDSAAVEAQ
jgi:hypothetical protein